MTKPDNKEPNAPLSSEQKESTDPDKKSKGKYKDGQ